MCRESPGEDKSRSESMFPPSTPTTGDRESDGAGRPGPWPRPTPLTAKLAQPPMRAVKAGAPVVRIREKLGFTQRPITIVTRTKKYQTNSG